MPASSDEGYFAAARRQLHARVRQRPRRLGPRRGAGAAQRRRRWSISVRCPRRAARSVGVEGDWPALAVDLPLKGISYQLAFNSELMALEGHDAQTERARAAVRRSLAGRETESGARRKARPGSRGAVEVGPARRTAAAHDAARAQRQQEAEREIGADPFVQSLIREFGASIVPGSDSPDCAGRRRRPSARRPLIPRAPPVTHADAPDFRIHAIKKEHVHDERPTRRPDEAGPADAGQHEEGAGGARADRGRGPVGRRPRQGRR